MSSPWWAAHWALLLLLPAAVRPARAQEITERHRVSAPIAFYDDADVTPMGTLAVTSYFGYDRLKAGEDISGPTTYFSLGLHPRFSVFGDVGRVHSRFEQFRLGGLGDSYFGGKILLLKEGRLRPAVAAEPILEVLGQPSIADNLLAPNRVNFVQTLIAQKTAESYRFYYMAGYFTRGIVFQSLTGELDRWERVTPQAVFSTARVTREQSLISELGLNQSRADLEGGVTVQITKTWSIFVMAGRSLGRMDLNTSNYQLSAGMTFNLRLWGER